MFCFPLISWWVSSVLNSIVVIQSVLWVYDAVCLWQLTSFSILSSDGEKLLPPLEGWNRRNGMWRWIRSCHDTLEKQLPNAGNTPTSRNAHRQRPHFRLKNWLAPPTLMPSVQKENALLNYVFKYEYYKKYFYDKLMIIIWYHNYL
jgi:hypothetical protein